MKKKIALGLGALATAVAVLPLFAAFEAHVINVTARIENALAVSTKAIDFGTVFPQEHLEQPLSVRLSGSFLEEDRVDDVEYFIRQKPKCGITSHGGTVLDHSSTATGHVSVDAAGNAVIDCGEPPRALVNVADDPQTPEDESANNETWGVLPSLCEYISKGGDVQDTDGSETFNDSNTPSFHKPWEVVSNAIQWLDTNGRLAKSAGDIDDLWIIDLAVPCFGNYCAQDWADFVHQHNEGANPDQYTQDIANEHKVFGCDLWVEVSGVSEARQPEI